MSIMSDNSTPFTLTTWHIDGLKGFQDSGVSSTTWPSANRAHFYPIIVNRTLIITQLFVNNGNTATGNFDIGIYSIDGTRVVSTGSTAQSGTQTVQPVNITDTMIGPGLFYLALTFNGTSSTAMEVSLGGGANTSKALGIYSQSTAFPLPATATFATAQDGDYFICGMLIGPNTLI